MKEFKRNGYKLMINNIEGRMIYRITHDRSSKYKPEIYIDDYSNEDELTLEVQTTSYGSLNYEQMQEMISELTKANNTAKIFKYLIEKNK